MAFTTISYSLGAHTWSRNQGDETRPCYGRDPYGSEVATACGNDNSQDTRSETPTDTEDDPKQGSGGSQPTGPCSTRHCDATALFTCFEWGVDDDEHVRLCGQTGGEVSAGPCPDANKVAGCKSTSPFSDQGCVINWGYGPALVEADVSEDCQERKGELVH